MTVGRNLAGLNDHLFAQLEKVGNEDLEGDALAQELERTKALIGISNQIISNAALSLQAQKALAERTITKVPALLHDSKDAQ